MKKESLRYTIVFIVFLFTCLFCNWPDFHPEDHMGLEYHWALDMLFHGSYFFVSSVVLLFTLSSFIRPLIICLTLWMLAFLLEITQLWIPGRTFTLLDLTSNTLGISFGWLLFQISKIYKAKNQNVH
ncbi:MAG TPA: VanZ family protein [Cytophagaceae bacterium]|nr:VanZ family protein [Cytophagaceae bacterium]